ncbi:hypothetical protein AMAG_05082 [Allomyces macrogynus ATCC 38327]|uniref:Uncharacterized protein n=1 Tax=Allomyces macrogynus (strain ATCC 38327) TaxID=578462 RepID=A0A0L0S6W0_ALLM3|nr:hypothetical protein AMAG_05082 [Allomyces macrogynus ATCC 38327]|eukprot:KNE58272.1 hypothetical protein AMAG_05082 [Allomyces macrogynus ATCC 38327]
MSTTAPAAVAAAAPATAPVTTAESATTTPSPVPAAPTSFPDLPSYTAHPVYASLIARIRRAEKFGSSVADDDRHLYRAFKFGTYADAKPESAKAAASTPAKGGKGKTTPSSAPASAKAPTETEQGEVPSTGRRGGRRSRVSPTSAAAKLASGILDQGKTAVDSVQSGRVSKRSAASAKTTPAAASTKAAASKPATPTSLIASLTDEEKLERLRRGRKFQVQSADMAALEAWYKGKHGENGVPPV